jgi:hypothetical protein
VPQQIARLGLGHGDHPCSTTKPMATNAKMDKAILVPGAKVKPFMAASRATASIKTKP